MRTLFIAKTFLVIIFNIFFIFSNVFAQSDQQLLIQTNETKDVTSGNCSMIIEGKIITGIITDGKCLIPADRNQSINNETPTPSPTQEVEKNPVSQIINSIFPKSDDSCDQGKIFCKNNISDFILNALGLKNSKEITNKISDLSGIIVTTGSVTAAATILSPFFLISNLPHLFLSSFFIIFYIKKQNPWGIVYDEETMEAIPFAIIRLKDSVTNEFIKDTVSDINGRFTFTVDRGSYYLDIRAQGYNQLTNKKNALNNVFYTGEIINIPKDGLGISVKIPLLKENTNLSAKRRVISYIKYRLPEIFETIIFITLIFVIVLVFFRTTYTNVLMLIFYTITYFFITKNKRKYYSSNGFVYDISNKIGIQGAFVKILDKTGDLSADLILTDKKGHFDLLANNGNYILQIESPEKEVKIFNNSEVKNKEIDINYSQNLKMKVGMGGGQINELTD